MQENVKILYKAISEIITNTRKEKGIKYTDFCYENEIPMSTYDDVINSKTRASFYNVARIVKALDLSFEEFGRLLDKNLPKDFLEIK